MLIFERLAFALGSYVSPFWFRVIVQNIRFDPTASVQELVGNGVKSNGTLICDMNWNNNRINYLHIVLLAILPTFITAKQNYGTNTFAGVCCFSIILKYISPVYSNSSKQLQFSQ